MTTTSQITFFHVSSHIQQLPRHFCFESRSCFLFDNDTQRHANKCAQWITDFHRQPYSKPGLTFDVMGSTAQESVLEGIFL